MSKKFSIALILSVLLHVLLAVALLFGDFSAHTKPKPTAAPMEPIQAVVIDSGKVAEQVNNIKKKQEEDSRKLKEYESQVASAQKKRVQEEKRIKNLEKQRKIK